MWIWNRLSRSTRAALWFLALALVAGLAMAADGFVYVRLWGGEVVPEDDASYKYVSLLGGEVVVETKQAAAAAARRYYGVR